MKKTVFVAAFAACVRTMSAPVSEIDAVSAASTWIRSNPSVASGTVTSVVDSTSYYVCLRSDGGALFMSKDDRLPPVVASVDSYSADRRIPLYSMLEFDMSNMTSRCSTKMLSAFPSSPFASNSVKWRNLIAGRIPLRASFSNGQYIVPGFENGGKFTHWNQTSDDASPGIGSGVKRPLYNGYMFGKNAGGTSDYNLGIRMGDSSTLVTNVAATFFPCGCVATAYAACAQFFGCTGAVSRISLFNTVTRQYDETDASFQVYAPTNAYITGTTWSGMSQHNFSLKYPVSRTAVPGSYDWSVLPSNLGGSAPAVSHKSLMSEEARDLIGRVTFNFGLEALMNYGYDGSGCYAYTPAVAWSAKTINDSFKAGSYKWCHPGFGDRATVIRAMSSSSTKSNALAAVNAVVRAGRPVLCGIQDGTSGHAVLAVGRDVGALMTRFFMGWGGLSDGWYATDDVVSIAGYNAIQFAVIMSGTGNDTVPVYGRVVDVGGNPVYNARVDIYAKAENSPSPDPSSVTFGPGDVVKTFYTGQDGWYRGFYVPPSRASSSDSTPYYYYEKITFFGSSSAESGPADHVPGVRVFQVGSPGSVFVPSGSWTEQSTKYTSTPLDQSGYASGTYVDPLIVGRPVDKEVDFGGCDAKATTSAEFDYFSSEAALTGKSLFLFFGTTTWGYPFEKVSGFDGAMSVLVSTNLFGRYTRDEYAVYPPLSLQTLLSTDPLAYGVSTNSFDLDRYVEIANEKMEEED